MREEARDINEYLDTDRARKFADDVIEILTKRQKLGRFPIDNTRDVTIVVRQDVCRSEVAVDQYWHPVGAIPAGIHSVCLAPDTDAKSGRSASSPAETGRGSKPMAIPIFRVRKP